MPKEDLKLTPLLIAMLNMEISQNPTLPPRNLTIN
jgi:hypothetical protein